jgi:hypothetical protein
MWVIRATTARGRLPEPSEHVLPGGYVGQRIHVRLGGQVVAGTHVPDDDARAADIRQQLATVPGYRVVSDAEVATTELVDPASEAPRLDDERAARDRISAVALANGWPADDLHDAWDGTANTREQKSPTTGLTLLEMAQTTPPKDWATLRGRSEPPWSDPDWHRPHPGWAPPPWSRTPAPPVEPPVVPPAPDGGDEPTVMIDEPISVDAPTVIIERPEAVLLVEQTAWPEGADPYPADQAPEALAVVRKLRQRFQQAPGLARTNKYLKESKLRPLAAQAELDWFLTHP